MTDAVTTIQTPTTPRWLRGRVVELRNWLLVVESGPEAGRQFGPFGEQATIGREDWCDIGLTDPRVSKQHCEITWTREGLRLRDLGSTNGVYWADARVYDVVLPSEARLRLGSTILRVVIEQGTQTQTIPNVDASGMLVGSSAPAKRLFSMMQRLAPREIPILLLGETGTGKTAVARAMHAISGRGQRPFVSINCAAVPAELIESTLFGHVRGAFTGAHRDTTGLFEQAAGGSVLLDEIGEMPLALQAKLLSVLESGVVRPVGSEREVPVDLRLFSATNRSLVHEVSAGRFRQDLYYRIAGIEIAVPPLRDRLADLRMLAEWFTLRCGNQLREKGVACGVTGVSDDAMLLLEQHTWPGNVRELENVISRAVAMAESDTIMADDVLLTTWQAGYDELSTPAVPSVIAAPPAPAGRSPTGVVSFKEFKEALLAAHASVYFQSLLAQTGGNLTRAAELSGLSRGYLRGMVRKYGM